MELKYFKSPLSVVGIVYVLHCWLVFNGFSHVGFLVGFIFSLVPLLGPFAGFIYLVSIGEVAAVVAIAVQVLLFGFMIISHPLYKKRWTAYVSAMGALLWCLSGFFYLYALAT